MEDSNKSIIEETFFEKLVSKLKNDYNYYIDVTIMCNDEESQKYFDRAEEIMSILEWCEKNYK